LEAVIGRQFPVRRKIGFFICGKPVAAVPVTGWHRPARRLESGKPRRTELPCRETAGEKTQEHLLSSGAHDGN